MGKAKLGFLFAGAYALGLVLLLGVAAALPCETLPRVRSALGRVPEMGQRAATLVRVAVHAGALGVKHLPAFFEPQGATPRRHSMRFCSREPVGGCGRNALPLPPSGDSAVPTFIRVVVRTDG